MAKCECITWLEQRLQHFLEDLHIHAPNPKPKPTKPFNFIIQTLKLFGCLNCQRCRQPDVVGVGVLAFESCETKHSAREQGERRKAVENSLVYSALAAHFKASNSQQVYAEEAVRSEWGRAPRGAPGHGGGGRRQE
jgi:hypothetical protein